MTTHKQLTDEGARALMEATAAAESWPDYNSAHEALGVLLEEVKEFEVEVFKKQSTRDPAKMKRELHQIAAVAIRAAALCDDDWVRR